MPTRDGYARCIFVQEASGFCVDVPGHMMLLAATPTVDEQLMVVNGSSRPIARTHVLQLPIINECHISALRDMCALDEPVTVYMLGMKRHQIWSVPECLDLVDARRGSANMAGAVVRLQSHAYEAGIFQSDNILEGFPWNCASSVARAGSAASGSGTYGSGSGSVDNEFWFLQPGKTDFVGPYWDPGGPGASTDFTGVLTKSGSIDPVLDWILPIQGATLTIEESVNDMTVYFYDWSGALISSANKPTGTESLNVLVPNETWRILFSVDEAGIDPRVTVASAGASLEPRVGIDKLANGSWIGVPAWSS